MRALASAVVLLSLAIAGCDRGKKETTVVPHSPAVDKSNAATKAKHEAKEAKETKAEPAEKADEEEAPGEAPAKPE